MFDTGTPEGLFVRRAIRDDRWKLHTGNGYPPDLFFDLQSDPAEKLNLLEGTLNDEQTEALARLKDALPKKP